MPQRMNEEEMAIATEVLHSDPRKYWCLKCARPRSRDYCPVTARTDATRHKTTKRSNIPLDKQLEWYLYQG